MTTNSRAQNFELRAVAGAGAGELIGLDCSKPFDAATIASVRQAFLTYPILVFREQPLKIPELVNFTKQFGELEYPDRVKYTHPDDPAVLVLSNELRPDGTAIGIIDAGDALHTDMQFADRPVLATILQSIRNPNVGGATEFVNMYMTYDALPAEIRRRVEGKLAVTHPSKLRSKRVTVSAARYDAVDYYAATEERIPDKLQPIVRTHPETGRQALFVSPRFSLQIAGLEEEESDELLDAIFDIIDQPQFKYAHKWRDNDIVMWDNRCLLHRATGGYALPDIRLMHRTQIQGDAPFYRSN
jgi:taurine dioxygenase